MEAELHQIYPDYSLEAIESNLLELLPRDKHDFLRANLVVGKGFPAIRPLLPHLLTWLQDLNWPIARVLAPFLATIGRPLLPEIRVILCGNDDIWKHNILSAIVSNLDEDCIEALQEELRVLADKFSVEGVDELARELLARLPGHS